MSIDLGMPQPAAEPLAPRRKSRQIMVGKGKHAVAVGGGALGYFALGGGGAAADTSLPDTLQQVTAAARALKR